jgi:hypothetical protein
MPLSLLKFSFILKYFITFRFFKISTSITNDTYDDECVVSVVQWVVLLLLYPRSSGSNPAEAMDF